MDDEPPANPELALLIRLFDEAYSLKAWHGPNLRGSIRGITAEEAAWQPAGKRHCIAEIVTHAAYWKYAVRRQLTGGDRGSFPLKGSNWSSGDCWIAEAARMGKLVSVAAPPEGISTPQPNDWSWGTRVPPSVRWKCTV